MTLTDQQILDIVNAILDHEGVSRGTRVQHLMARRSSLLTQRAFAPLVERCLSIENPPRTCQVEHDHWEGKMICGNPMPCRTHGG